MSMVMVPVENGGIIKAIGYDPDSQKLFIKFKLGSFVFDEVPEPLHASFIDAKHKLTFFRENIAGFYAHRRLEPEHPTEQ